MKRFPAFLYQTAAIFVSFSLLFNTPVLAGEFSVFKKTYIRDTGEPEAVADTFTVPNLVTAWTLRAVNGSLTDKKVKKISSALVTLNGTKVIKPQDLNQRVREIEREVAIESSNTIETELRSRPGGQFTVEIVGEDNDPPTVAIIEPADGASLTDPRPGIIGTYSDALSAIDLLSVTLLYRRHGRHKRCRGRAGCRHLHAGL